MIITISGPPGSGKTTVGRLLADKMDMEFISTGMIFREMAQERGISLPEFGKMALENHDIDKELDKRMLALAKEKKDIILEGRLTAHMLHLNGIKCFKVWIEAHIHTRAGRISGREGKNPEQVRLEILEREKCEWDRYKKIYDIDLKSLAVYDLVINSDDMTPEQIVSEIMNTWEAS
ncbi:MAG: AAA family ATPase [Thermoplasmata archaeon]